MLILPLRTALSAQCRPRTWKLPPASNVLNVILAKMMIDPFEVRMRFTTQLQHLSASVTSSQKAAHYALKYRDLDEDLHSCILEQIERVKRPTALLLRFDTNLA